MVFKCIGIIINKKNYKSLKKKYGAEILKLPIECYASWEERKKIVNKFRPQENRFLIEILYIFPDKYEDIVYTKIDKRIESFGKEYSKKESVKKLQEWAREELEKCIEEITEQMHIYKT